jgi:putative tryptophan/tyrosine transport system substrate-binding protein
MDRRNFIRLVGGAAVACSNRVHAQQPAMPVVGFLHSASAQGYANQLRVFLEELAKAGYVEGRNVAIEYRWAENRIDRLPILAAELARSQVSVIVAGGSPASALAAKSARQRFRLSS